jgi:hypothetical protein
MDTRKSVTVQVQFSDTVDNVKELLGFLSRTPYWNERLQQKVALDNAIEHIELIARIIQNPGDNAMLIGVGASDKQSLPKLTAYICGYESVLLSVSSSLKVKDLKEQVRSMYKQAAIKGVPTVWLMTDQQIVNEQFLIHINKFPSGRVGFRHSP